MREAKSPFTLSQGQTQPLTGATDLQGVTVPSLSRAPSHQGVLQPMLASGFRHQLTNPSSYRKISRGFQPRFPLFAVTSLPFSPFPFPLLCLPAPTQTSPAKCHFHRGPALPSRPRDERDARSPSPPTQRGFTMYSGRQHHLHIFPPHPPSPGPSPPPASSPSAHPLVPSSRKLPQGQFFSFPLQIFVDHYRLWSHPGCRLSKQNSRRTDRGEGQMDGGRVRWEPGEQSGHNDKGSIKPRLGLAN